MRTIPLTQDKVALVDDEDFDCLSQHKWCAQKQHSGDWYAVRNSPTQNGKRPLIRMHREILKPPTGMETDHWDRNGLNNRRNNLRVATRAQNQYNRRKQKSTSRFKGVSWFRRDAKWYAHIKVAGKCIHLGCFLSEVDAAKAYDEAARKYFGEFACTNF